MADMNDSGYDSKTALPNKLIRPDGVVTDFAGNVVVSGVDAYFSKPAIPNKWLNPDGTISTLTEIVTNMIDNDIFLIVSELPEEGQTDKIYLVVEDSKLIEYLWVNDAWDPVGMVEFDITNYYTKTEATALIAASLTEAKSYADNKANAAETNAKNYTDSAIQQSITQVLGGSY